MAATVGEHPAASKRANRQRVDTKAVREGKV
jgi:hypothetical protein